MRTSFIVLSLGLALALVACGPVASPTAKGLDRGDSEFGPDAGPATAPDAEPVEETGPEECLFQPTEAIGIIEDPTLTYSYYLHSKLRLSFYTDPTESIRLSVALRDGEGVFVNGIKPGTYELDENDGRYDRCVICIKLYNRDEEIGYMASSGSVTITEADIENEVLHLTAQELGFSPYESVDRDDGASCTTTTECGGVSVCNLTHERCQVGVPLPNVCDTSIGSLTL